MGALIVLGILFSLGPLVLSIVTAVRFGGLKASVEELKQRISKLEGGSEARAAQSAPERRANPPPLPDFLKPPPVPIATSQPQTSVPKKPQPSSPNWESILGVKLFAWIGGLALFLGVVFFIKYAVENNWTTPTMRVVTGAVVATLLIVIALFPAVRRYRVPAQSLCATGVLILYADIYAAYSFYNLIALTPASVLMWIVTGAALILATCIDARSVVWLALVGGFIMPFFFRVWNANPILLFGYVAALDCGAAAVSSAKRWKELLPAAAFASVVLVFAWEGGAFGERSGESSHVFLMMEALFLCICTAVAWKKSLDNWTIAAMGIAGLVAVFAVARLPWDEWDLGSATLLSNAGLIAFVTLHRHVADKGRAMATLVALALALTWLGEWHWCNAIVATFGPLMLDANAAWAGREHMWFVTIRHVEIFLLFAATPYLAGAKRFWPWLIAAIAGPLQFWFVHAYATSPDHLVRDEYLWLLPIAFALPAAIGVIYLVKREHVDLASGDSRLATQGAAVLGFVSLIFPIQFEREWITLGWAFEGLALILLFHWIPNRRLRAVALIVLCAAFVRLALNPAVFDYHLRTATPILNWYLYAYGFSALCLFLSARWFGDPREKTYERGASSLLYSLSGIVLFLLMNIEIADYFSKGLTLTFSFSGNFARDMTYTIAWSLFALALLVFGIGKKVRAVRFVAIALLMVAFAKLFLHDLDSLNQLYRIGAFVTVAVIAIVASFVYQRFLSPAAEKT